MLSRLPMAFLLVLIASTTFPLLAGASDKVFVLKQVEDGSRIRTVCVGDDGIKFVQGDMALLSSAPDWKVIHLNLKMKTFFETPAKEFKGVSWLGKIPGKVEALKEKSDSEKVAGLKVDSYAAGDLLVRTTGELPLKEKSLDFVRTVYGQKALSGLPLSIAVKKKEKKDQTLQTDWCMKKDQPGKFFSVPRGYTAVKSLAEIEKPSKKGLKRVRKFRPFQK